MKSSLKILSNITYTQWNHRQYMCRCRYHRCHCLPYLLHPGDMPACWYSQRNPRTHRFRRRSPLNSHTGTLSECSSLHPTYTWNSQSDRAEMKTNTHYLIIVGTRGGGGRNNVNQNVGRNFFVGLPPPPPSNLTFYFILSLILITKRNSDFTMKRLYPVPRATMDSCFLKGILWFREDDKGMSWPRKTE